jgi:light-regulated signal transduction histidine kinase (bacteriophytochrome)
LQILEKNYKNKLDSNADELIDLADSGATRMRNLINDLLALSHVNSGNIVFQNINLSKAIAESMQNLAVHIKETKAKVIYNSLPTISGDKTQIIQLFQNLINNAIKFCKTESPEIHIEAKEEHDHWLISVHDNGIGFEQQYANRIFEPFKRLHTQAQYPGNGMGLTICKRIVERHNGKIWVESETGKGTTFFFTLPCRKEDI